MKYSSQPNDVSRHIRNVVALYGVASILMMGSTPANAQQFAYEVVDFELGMNAEMGYENPLNALGPPTRFTGGFIFPGVVSAFNPPWWFDDIVSIGAGGFLTVKFESPIQNHPHNLYGVDFIIFSNTGFIDDGTGHVENPATMFGDDGGVIEVSADGKDWRTIRGIPANGPMPTIGYMDSHHYATTPGTVLTNFAQPIDPALTPQHFSGFSHEQILQLYRGAAGGTGVDIASVGLDEIQYVRISNAIDAIQNVEIDAMCAAEPRRPGDVNLDGVVNVPDLLAVISAWGPTVPGGPPADFNNDNAIGVPDLLTVISNWGE